MDQQFWFVAGYHLTESAVWQQPLWYRAGTGEKAAFV
jgi:hypothetical protein